MNFGPIMRVAHPEFDLTLAPLRRDETPQMVHGLSRSTVTRYTMRQGLGYSAEDAESYYDHLRTTSGVIAWGIFREGDSSERELLGVSDAHLANGSVRTAMTGSMLYDPDLWGCGIASACHRARTWYLLHIVGVDALRSEHFVVNEASGRALHRVGYVQTGIKRNAGWFAGEALHAAQVECVNPADAPWARWWGNEPVPAEFVEGRERTRAALAWADENVTLL